MIDTTGNGAPRPIPKGSRSPPPDLGARVGNEDDSEDADDYDEFGNKLSALNRERADDSDGEVVERNFDLIGQLDEALGGVPEQLKPLVLSAG